MKKTFKRLVFSAILLITGVSLTYASTLDFPLDEIQVHEVHKKIEKLHRGFELIFLKGEKEGHIILAQIQSLPLHEDKSVVGQKFNTLIKELNAIFKTVHHIVTKYKGKGPNVLMPFLFEIGKSCNLEELFKKTITELEEIKRLHESVNENNECQQALISFITFLKEIQPIWHQALSQKELIVKNLRASL